METKDLYKVLGVGKGASQEEVRRAYRRLAREHHPDANRDDPKAEERFKEVQHAYEVLSNPEKRREYDEGPRAYFGGAPRGGTQGRSDANFSDLSDLFGSFGDIFGGVGREHTTTRGEDVTVSVNLRFKDALEGVTTRVATPVEEACDKCRGTGAAPGTTRRMCPECSGRGMRSRDQGFFALSEPCGRCGGEGAIVEKPCAGCSGSGRLRRNKSVTVKIPAGARDGMKIRVPGGGTVKLRLPAGTQDGKRFKVREAGAPRAKGGGEPGNLVVRVRVVVPKKLNKRGKEILEALAEERDEHVREGLLRKAREAGQREGVRGE